MNKLERFLNRVHTKEDLIKFFTKIPEKNWTVGEFKSKCKFIEGEPYAYCALGHMGIDKDTYLRMDEILTRVKQILGLKRLIKEHIIDVNDGYSKKFRQASPKKRILAYLESK